MTVKDAKERAAAAVSDELVDAVVADALEGGVELLGPDGVLAELTKRVLERALAEEMTDHLGYEHGDPIGHGTGNNRNGTTPKQVLTEIGAVDLDVPRDRNATFEPKIVTEGCPAPGGLLSPTSWLSTPEACPLVTSVRSWLACTVWMSRRRWCRRSLTGSSGSSPNGRTGPLTGAIPSCI